MPFTLFSNSRSPGEGIHIKRHLPTLLALSMGVMSLTARADTAPACPAAFKPVAADHDKQPLASALGKAAPCQLVPSVSVSSLASLWDMLTNGEKTGGKRFDTPPPAGSPDGTIYAPQGTPVIFDFSSIASQGLQHFVLMDGSRALLDINTPPAKQTVRDLLPGHPYHWELNANGSSYHADFQLMDPDDAAEVTQRLQAINASKQPENVKQFYRAAVFDDEGLYADRDRILAQLRRQP